MNLQELWLQKEEEDDEFDECLGCEMTRFGQRVYLIKNVRVNDYAKIASR